MASRSDELQYFKRIDLVQYAVGRGFLVDHRASSKSSVVVRHTRGDKLIVSRDRDGTYFYFNAKGGDSGTIIDLIQSLDGGSIGDVRKTLRGYSPSQSAVSSSALGESNQKQAEKDRSTVKEGWNRAEPLERESAFLSGCRSVPKSVYLDEKFAGRLRVDGRGNILAAHHDSDGLCGFEIKNGTAERTTFTGFSPGGTKGLFCSRSRPEDRTMILAETFIDALSVAAITGIQGYRFFSLGGHPSPIQLKLLKRAVLAMPPMSIVEMRFDHDEGGQRLAAIISAEVLAGADNIRNFRFVRPRAEGADWNDVLRESGSIQEKRQFDQLWNRWPG